MRAMRIVRHGVLPAIAMVTILGGRNGEGRADELKAGEASPLIFRTATVARGNLVATIRATGTVEPEEVVDVGAEVAGRITRLGADPKASGKTVDFGSQVEEGTLLAQIDDTLYAVQLEQARAGCQRAEAELVQTKARLALATAELQRAQARGKDNTAAASEFEIAKRRQELAAESVVVAEASLAQGRVALKQAQVNLDRTRIRSPVKGVILDRRVNVGQSVVAGLNAPSLFLVATDLKKLQVWVSVNEADIGQILRGQVVRFTVDAFPDATFRGTVEQIRLNATMTQNVVTYTVVVATDNSDGKLLPYLTANVQFEVGRRTSVLLVPNAALRWRPEPQLIAPDVRAQASQRSRGHRVWLSDGKFVRPLSVEIGLSDSVSTEIVSGDLKEGTRVVVGASVTASDVGPNPASKPAAVAGAVLQSLLISPKSQKAIQNTLASMGTNQLLVLPGAPGSSGVSFGSGSISTLTPEDADEIARRCPAVSHVTPIIRGRAQVVYGSQNWVPYVVQGAAPPFLAIRDWEELAEGEAFTDADVRNASKVCLIGDTLKRELFQGQSPLGREIRIQNVAFKVIGVLKHKGANIMGLDQDDLVLAPWTTVLYQVKEGKRPDDSGRSFTAASSVAPARQVVRLDQILAKAVSAQQIPQAAKEIRETLRQGHHISPGQPDDFQIRDMTELTKTLTAPFRQ